MVKGLVDSVLVEMHGVNVLLVIKFMIKATMRRVIGREMHVLVVSISVRGFSVMLIRRVDMVRLMHLLVFESTWVELVHA